MGARNQVGMGCRPGPGAPAWVAWLFSPDSVPGIDSSPHSGTSKFRLWHNNPIPTRFLALVDSSKIPAHNIFSINWKDIFIYKKLQRLINFKRFPKKRNTNTVGRGGTSGHLNFCFTANWKIALLATRSFCHYQSFSFSNILFYFCKFFVELECMCWPILCLCRPFCIFLDMSTAWNRT